MRRLLALAAALALGTGCMSLDFMFLDAPQVDAYRFDEGLVPATLTEEVRFDRGDGVELAGVWLRQPYTTSQPALVFFHGNGNNLETDFERIAWYWSWGAFDVFAADYSGYGASDGEASWDALATRDGEAILRYVADTRGVAVDTLPVVALSLGGFVAIHAADDASPRALILESVFANSDLLVDESLRLDLPPGWFFEEDWENHRAIADVRAPLFVIHGLADDYIDPRSGPILHDAAGSEIKELWQPEGVGHSDLFRVDPDGYRDRVLEFLATRAP